MKKFCKHILKPFTLVYFAPFPHVEVKNRFDLVLVQRLAEGSDMTPIKTENTNKNSGVALLLAFAAILKGVFSMR